MKNMSFISSGLIYLISVLILALIVLAVAVFLVPVFVEEANDVFQSLKFESLSLALPKVFQ